MAHHKTLRDEAFSRSLETRVAPAAGFVEAFDTTTVGMLPVGWSQYGHATNPVRCFVRPSPSPRPTGFLPSRPAPQLPRPVLAQYRAAADGQTGTDVYLNSIIPVRCLHAARTCKAAIQLPSSLSSLRGRADSWFASRRHQHGAGDGRLGSLFQRPVGVSSLLP